MQHAPEKPHYSYRAVFSKIGLTTDLSGVGNGKSGRKSSLLPNLRWAMSNYGCQLLKQTKFNRDEIAVLLHIFFKLCHGKKLMSSDGFKDFLVTMFRLTDKVALEAYTRAFSSDRSGNINPYKFVVGMNILLRGDINEKAKLVFHMLDVDYDGMLHYKVEFANFIKNVYDTNLDPTLGFEEPERDCRNYVVRKLDPISKDRVTLPRFQKVMTENPLLLECCFPIWPDEKLIIAFQRLLMFPVKDSSLLTYLR